MRNFVALLAFVLSIGPSLAIAADVSPSRKTVPKKFYNPPGKRFSLFSGDPKRIQKASEINFKDLKSELTITPGNISLSPTEGEATKDIEIKFKIRNKGKKSYTLSFPDAQRYDIAITVGDTEELAYLWSEDKVFEQTIGSSFMNPGDSISFKATIPVKAIKGGTGDYTVKVILANYPEVLGSEKLSITP